MKVKGAGTAKVCEIAWHWQVTAATARRIIGDAQLPPIGTGWTRYRWHDVWRLEGALYVPPRYYKAYKAPLVLPIDLPKYDPAGRSARTLRRYAAEGRIPVIFLTPTLRRFRETELQIAFEHI